MKRIEQIFQYNEFMQDELNAEQKALINYAAEMRELAYAPYSNFKVGASILLENDKMIGGNNQENIAYPSGLCAERVALFSANSQYPFAKIKAIAIISSNDIDVISPCGACRQVFSEVIKRQKEDFDVIMSSISKVIVVKASALLPLSFEF